MASTLTNLLYHVVFSTKTRCNTIRADLRDELYPYLGGLIRAEKGKLLEIGGTPNHIHVLAKFPASTSVADMMRRIKGNSSKWIDRRRIRRVRFAWQRGYAAFSVSRSAVNGVANYIRSQAKHHKKMTFRDEFIALLKKRNIAYDERYVFD